MWYLKPDLKPVPRSMSVFPLGRLIHPWIQTFLEQKPHLVQFILQVRHNSQRIWVNLPQASSWELDPIHCSSLGTVRLSPHSPVTTVFIVICNGEVKSMIVRTGCKQSRVQFCCRPPVPRWAD